MRWKLFFTAILLISTTFIGIFLFNNSNINTVSTLGSPIQFQLPQIYKPPVSIEKNNAFNLSSAPTIPAVITDASNQTHRDDNIVWVTDVERQSAIEKADEISRWLNQNGNPSPEFDLGKEMQKRFEAEARDVFWAEQEEQKLENIFAHNLEFSGVALREVSCRTSQCMLSIGITDIEQANQLVDSVINTIESENTFYSVIAAPNEQQGVTKLFISRAGNSFQFN